MTGTMQHSNGHSNGFGGADAYLRAEIEYRATKVRDDWAPRRRRRSLRPRRSAA